MTEMKKYRPGDFCWTELATSDTNAAKKLYSNLFGWKANEMPTGPDQPPYIMMQINGKNVCAMYENKKAPTKWSSYVSVANVDESAKKAKSLGGKLKTEPFDVMDVGRMANVLDSQGAVFALWQPKRHIGAELINEPNTMCWNELMTNDIESARKFYSALFGWKLNISPQYTEAAVGDINTAGMMQMDERMRGVSPYWAPYFAVTDTDGTTKKAKSSGARIHVKPTDIPEVGRFSVMSDPQGAIFSVIKLQPASG